MESLKRSAFRVPRSEFQSFNTKHETRNAELFFLVCAVCCVLFAASALACPGCKEALIEPGELPQRLATAKGYALSIGLFLTVPVLLVSAVAIGVFRATRRRAVK
ncbi:MAG: hypothetical protein HYU33_03815 [Candidatus Omnitrophica bacterium]|nr:hypothetical protein [Candidatus Omnitrophota bacterium]